MNNKLKNTILIVSLICAFGSITYGAFNIYELIMYSNGEDEIIPVNETITYEIDDPGLYDLYIVVPRDFDKEGQSIDSKVKSNLKLTISDKVDGEKIEFTRSNEFIYYLQGNYYAESVYQMNVKEPQNIRITSSLELNSEVVGIRINKDFYSGFSRIINKIVFPIVIPMIILFPIILMKLSKKYNSVLLSVFRRVFKGGAR